ncbi:MAG: hypothetical protein JWL64_1717 [Frankiales bacterium]|nr:hypothetical protein [Frankiales bacterium]
MTSRSLTALAAGVALTGSLVAATAGPALAQTYPSPTPGSTTSPARVAVSVVFDDATNTITITLTGLQAGTKVIVVVVAQGAASGASYTPAGGLVVRTADYELAGALTAATRTAAASQSFTGVADAAGVARIPASLAAFGDLTAAQVEQLQYTVNATKADGTAYTAAGPVNLAATTGTTIGTTTGTKPGKTAATASGALPRTGSSIDVAPLIASGLGLLVVGGSIVLVARRRREDFVV